MLKDQYKMPNLVQGTFTSAKNSVLVKKLRFVRNIKKIDFESKF